jgi:acetyl-CoA carboxylase carboxyltransferase component
LPTARPHEQALDEVRAAAQVALDGGGETARQRHVSRGKILPRERVSRLLDRALRSWKSACWPPMACMTAQHPRPA